MNSKQLHYFLKIVQTGSITAAAKEMDLAQPAVSQQLANLEHELKSQLFERDFRGVRLTQTGERFYQSALSIVQQMDSAKSDIIDSQQNPSGPLAIGLAQAVCNAMAIPLTQQIEALYPNIQLQIHSGTPEFLNHSLQQGEVDLVISYENTTNEKSFNMQPLLKEQIYLLVGKQPHDAKAREILARTSIDFAELANYEIVMPHQTDPISQLLTRYESKTGVTIKRKSNFGLLMTSLRYVTEGHGLIMLPSSAFFHLESAGQINAIPIVNPQITREVVLMHSTKRAMTFAMQSVMQLIKTITYASQRDKLWRGELLFEPHNKKEKKRLA